MNILRMVVVTAICGWILYHVGRAVISGLRAGRIPHTDSVSFCRRGENPFGYWALVVLLSGIALCSIYAWAQLVRAVFAL